MLRRFLAAFAAFAVVFLASTGLAFAQVDVNNADATQLQTIKGIGPAISAKIVAERKNGNFKDWADLEKRVSGIGDKNSAKFSEAGLTVGGTAKANAPMTAPAKTMAKTAPTAAPAPVAATPVPAPAAMTKAPAPVAATPAAPSAMTKAAAQVAPAAAAPGAMSKAAAPAAPAPVAPSAMTKAAPAVTNTAKTGIATTDAKATSATKKKDAKDDTAVAATPDTPKAGKTKAKKGDAADPTDATTKK